MPLFVMRNFVCWCQIVDCSYAFFDNFRSLVNAYWSAFLWFDNNLFVHQIFQFRNFVNEKCHRFGQLFEREFWLCFLCFHRRFFDITLLCRLTVQSYTEKKRGALKMAVFGQFLVVLAVFGSKKKRAIFVGSLKKFNLSKDIFSHDSTRLFWCDTRP